MQKTSLDDVIFKEYDIRGIVDAELFVSETYDLGRAIASFYLTQNPDFSCVVVGRDGRVHSLALENEIVRGMLDSGISVLLLGVCPTPTVSYMVYTQPVDGGIMVTASHNPKEFNGLKLYQGKKSLTGIDIQGIKKIYHERSFIKTDRCATSCESAGLVSYVAWLEQQFSHLKAAPISCVIDCGNGAAGVVLQPLVERMGWDRVQLLYADVDGTYPHHEADPTIEENMRDLHTCMQKSGVPYGIGLDGDGDRMAVMRHDGTLLAGDITLGLFAADILVDSPHASFVVDIKSSDSIVRWLEKKGGTVFFSPSGYPHVKKTVHKYGAICAGELSGHFFFNDRYWGYDDGIYACLRFIELYHKNNNVFNQCQEMPLRWSSREFRLPCSPDARAYVLDAVRAHYQQNTLVLCTEIDGIRVEGLDGWGLVRPSHTQNMVCIRVEGHTKKALIELLSTFMRLIEPFINIESMKLYRVQLLS